MQRCAVSHEVYFSLFSAGSDYVSIDETFVLSNSSTVEVSVNIIDDEALEALEFVTVLLDGNVTLSPTSLLLFINDNDRKCIGITLYSSVCTTSVFKVSIVGLSMLELFVFL